jgi:Icc-related predicted phosphoesterase
MARMLNMHSAKLIQLGDIHYPENVEAARADVKDRGAAPAVVSAIAPNRLRAVMRRINQMIEEEATDCLLICGDLTSRGNLDQYSACVEYLRDALNITVSGRLSADAIHVVPGNHDVNRAMCDPKETDLYVKFDPLVATWSRIGFNVLSARGIRSTTITREGGSLSVFSLNSCIGCGERRYLPQQIRDEIHAAIASYSSKAPPGSIDLVYEQLDTPAFVDDHLEDLLTRINKTSDQSLPIVLAHHNALPQSVPRVEVYTELINSGRFRTLLASWDRPLLYFHGHIHDDPIESIVNYRHPDAAVIMISAPLAVDGFNVADIAFARNGMPLGCSLTKYRTPTPGGAVEKGSTVRIPLIKRTMLPRFDDPAFLALLDICSSTATSLRFMELRDRLIPRINSQIQALTLRDIILEAEWLALVEVIDRDQPHLHWKIQRVTP